MTSQPLRGPLRCPFCGGIHPSGPVGEPGTWLEGIELKVCPQIPQGHIYEDREFDAGPRGALHKIGDGDD